MGFNASPRRHVRIRTLVAALVGVSALSGFAVARGVWAAEPQRGRAAVSPPVSDAQVAARTAPLADLESAFEAIAERMQPSVVSIRVDKTVRTASNIPDMGQLFQGFPGFPGLGGGRGFQFRQMPQQYHVSGAGSGVIVREDGWILTNDHVAGGADKVTVKLADGREFPGTVRRDFRSDLALVKINASGLVPAELGDSDRVRVGQWAIAFGSPFELDNTMTVGVISARARQQEVSERGEARAYTGLLQTDAAINPGNSGGPLVDIHGHIVGINVAIESPSGGSVGIGFAIPINTAKYVMDQLMTRGHVTRAYLGVGPRALTYDEKQKAGVANGAMIQSVQEGTPASVAGFQPGDIVVRYNGQPVTDDSAFRDMVARTAPGTRVDVEIIRDGHHQTLTPKVEEMPANIANGQIDQNGQPQQAPEAGGKLGVAVQPVTPEAVQQYNLKGITNGVVVVEVQSGSPAEQAGIQPGDVIIRANNRAVNSAADLSGAVRNAKSGDKVNLVVQHGDTRALVTVTIQ